MKFSVTRLLPYALVPAALLLWHPAAAIPSSPPLTGTICGCNRTSAALPFSSLWLHLADGLSVYVLVRDRHWSLLDEYGAAGDIDDDAADPRGTVGGEEQGRLGQFLGLPEPARSRRRCSRS